MEHASEEVWCAEVRAKLVLDIGLGVIILESGQNDEMSCLVKS